MLTVRSPYYGQAGWFIMLHPEKIPSAIERYTKEVLRVLGVLEGVLAKREWLVGEKCTIADISFVPYVSLDPIHAAQRSALMRRIAACRWNSAAFELFKKMNPEIDVERDFSAVTR